MYLIIDQFILLFSSVYPSVFYFIFLIVHSIIVCCWISVIFLLSKTSRLIFFLDIIVHSSSCGVGGKRGADFYLFSKIIGLRFRFFFLYIFAQICLIWYFYTMTKKFSLNFLHSGGGERYGNMQNTLLELSPRYFSSTLVTIVISD